jgi:leucine dehydrogenase
VSLRITRLVAPSGYERVLRADDPSIGYTGFIAVHSTALGPAVGGTRYWKYESDAEALADVLRLARAMTCKSALAGLPFGGGKSVIVRRGDYVDRSAIFRAHGRFVHVLNGAYITAEDVGTSPSDMVHLRSETPHVAGLPGESGDPAPHTARGVFRALLAASEFRWGEAALTRRTVAVQGCGAVGRHLALELQHAGASLVVCDTDDARARSVAEETGATVTAPDAIFGARADIFAPCALGGVLNAATIPRLHADIVAGGANNQLARSRDAKLLHERGIIHVPDYVANAGGIINGCRELAGWSEGEASVRVDAIAGTVREILLLAERAGVTPAQTADRMVEQRLAEVLGSQGAVAGA